VVCTCDCGVDAFILGWYISIVAIEVMASEYTFGEYGLDTSITHIPDDGRDELKQEYKKHVKSIFKHEPLKQDDGPTEEFNHNPLDKYDPRKQHYRCDKSTEEYEPLELNEEQQNEININFIEAGKKYLSAGEPIEVTSPECEDFINGQPPENHINLIIHALCQLNMLAMTGPAMYSMLAALAILVGDNMEFASNVLYALTIAYNQNEVGLVMTYTLFVLFRSTYLCQMLRLAGDPIKVVCWLLKRDERFNISISTLHKQLDRLLPGLRKHNREVVQDILIKIWLVYGRDRPEFESLCYSSFRKYCKDRRHHDCSDEVMENSWKRRIENEFSGIFHFTKLYLGMDPLEELHHMYLHDTLESMGLEGSHIHSTIKTDHAYNNPFMLPLPTIHRVMVLIAQCGMGKTNAMHSWLQELNPEHVVYISHRKALTQDALHRLGQFGEIPWKSYDDPELQKTISMQEHKRVICQFESLSRIDVTGCTNIVVVMDEFCSICKQMQSTCGNRACTQVNFMYLCEKADHILAMDGHMDQNRINILNRYCGTNAFVIHNKCMRKLEQGHDVKFTRDQGRTMAHIMNLLRKGEKVHVPCFSREVVEMLVQAVKTEFGDSKVVKSYTSFNRWNPDDDIDKELSGVDLFTHTCTIDTGLSYQNVHFKFCVALFTTSTPIDYEVAAQMIARSRPTIIYLICVRQWSKPGYQTTDLQDILDELKRDDVMHVNAFYFGHSVAFEKIQRESVATCCPYLLMIITNMSVSRRALNNFSFELAMLLFNEGASISSMWFDEDMKDMKKEFKAAKTAVTDASSEHLCELYNDSKFEMFESWSKEQRASYTRRHVVDTYNRLNKLRSHGPDFTAAVLRMGELYQHGCSALQVCANSNRFDPNLIVMADLDIGVRKGHYDYLAYRMASEMLWIYTGLYDPYQVTCMRQSAIQTNLECVLIDRKSFVSKQKTSDIFALHSRWKGLSPATHTPSYVIQETDMLTFKQAMTILAQILNVMFLFEFTKNEQPDPMYLMDTDVYFTDNDQLSKPMLQLWNQFPRPIEDRNAFNVGIQLDKNTIATTAQYMTAKRGMTGSGHGDRQIQATDVMQEEKTNKNHINPFTFGMSKPTKVIKCNKRKEMDRFKRQQKKEKKTLELTKKTRMQHATTIDEWAHKSETTEETREKLRLYNREAKKKQRKQMAEKQKRLDDKLDMK